MAYIVALVSVFSCALATLFSMEYFIVWVSVRHSETTIITFILELLCPLYVSGGRSCLRHGDVVILVQWQRKGEIIQRIIVEVTWLAAFITTLTHLQERVKEYLCQRLRHGEMAVAGADLKGRLQTLYGNCNDNERNLLGWFQGPRLSMQKLKS